MAIAAIAAICSNISTIAATISQISLSPLIVGVQIAAVEGTLGGFPGVAGYVWGLTPGAKAHLPGKYLYQVGKLKKLGF